MKTVIILQARMNSSRLPGKILMSLNGKTVLERVIERLKTFSKADDLIVATTNTFNDDVTCKLLDKIDVKYFRGSEHNVLKRYYLCALEYEATQIIRATADDPLTDIELLEKMFSSHLEHESDYTFSSGYPVGVQEEIVTFNALKKCYKKSTKENHFEHVLEYIQENKNEFKTNILKAPKELDRENVRVTLDTQIDYDIVNKYYHKINNVLDVTSKDIIEFWDASIINKSVVTIHQPEFIPWLGFFNKVYQSDILVILDNVKFKKGHFENRNKVRNISESGWTWLNIPVITTGKSEQEIKDVIIEDRSNWKNKILKTIKYSYSSTQYFDEVFVLIEESLNQDSKKLIDINIAFIKNILNYLSIHKKFILQSELDINSTKSQLLVDILNKTNADIYLSGKSGKEYLEMKTFEKNNIKVVFQNFEHPRYDQLHGEFISHMSILDILFNYGKSSINLIKEQNYE